MKIYAFSDEAAASLEGQIAALKRNGLSGMEIRGIDGQSIADVSATRAKEIYRKLTGEGLSVWSIGSPIGKISLKGDSFEKHLELLRHLLELTQILNCRNMRMFSFYLPEGVRPEDCRGEVIDRLARMAELADDAGILLCHENEKGIYGDIASRCAEVLDAVPSLRCVFDPANFIQCGQDVPEAWTLLGSRVYYMHIKDALVDGTVVPAGEGIGHLPELLRNYQANGGECVTIEPHLRVFEGLNTLEHDQKTPMTRFSYPSSDAAFDTACAALKKII